MGEMPSNPPDVPKPRVVVERRETVSDYRDRLRKEAEGSYAFEKVNEDSPHYRLAVEGTKALLKRGLDAADSVQKELQKQFLLPGGDPRKMSVEERKQYEDMLTQVESWAILLPHMLQEARVVQYQPEVQERLKEVFDLVHDRDRFIQLLERQRLMVLKGSNRNPHSPFDPQMPREFLELASVATVSWMIRERLGTHADLLDPGRKAELKEYLEAAKALRTGEPAFGEKTTKVGEGVEKLRTGTQAARQQEGPERVTQNFPGAERIAYGPENSMAVWNRLLKEGGTAEKQRYARQLREAIGEFRRDFIDKKALKDFLKDAESKKDAASRGNSMYLFWFKLIGRSLGETVGERLVTTPEEFDALYKKIVEKMSVEFDQIATPEHKQLCDDLASVLSAMEKGEKADDLRLQELLTKYTRMHEKIATVLVALQHWQVAENVGRVGGNNAPNNLEQGTRIGNTSVFQSLNDMAPYGILQRRSYVDPQGRLILLDPPKTPERSGAGRNIVESGKAALILDAAIATGVLQGWAMKQPLLGFLLNRWYLRLAPPLAAAAATIQISNLPAGITVQNAAIERMDASIDRLSAKGGKRLNRLQAQEESEKLYRDLVLVLHAATHARPDRPKAELSLEAHVFLNQLLASLGYPPFHERPSGLPMKPDEKTSPEVKNYLSIMSTEKGLDTRTRLQLDDLRLTLEGSKANPVTGEPERREEPLQALLSGKYPVDALKTSFHVDDRNISEMRRHLIDAAHDPSFVREGGKMQKTLQALSERKKMPVAQIAYSVAGQLWLDWLRMDALTAHFLKYPKFQFDLRDKIPLKEEFAPGRMLKGKAFHREEVEESMKKVFADLSPLEVLAIGAYLESYPPDNEQVLKYWLQQERPSFDVFGSTDKTIDKTFGSPQKRGGLGNDFFGHWANVMGYETIRREEKK